MKILHTGTPPKERVWRGECRSCGSIAEAKEGELKKIIHDQRDGSLAWEECPVCGAGRGLRYGGMLFYPVKQG